MLSSYANANFLIIVPANRKFLKKGEKVMITGSYNFRAFSHFQALTAFFVQSLDGTRAFNPNHDSNLNRA